MKRKVFCFLLAVLAIAIFSLGCGGGGGSHSNPASPSISSTARVSGVIVDSSKKPAENVDVRLALVSKSNLNALPENFRAALRLATADTQTEFNTTTDKNGVYSFENVPYGRYSLSADAGTQGAYVANLNVDAAAISPQEQTLTPFGFVSGTVITNNGKNDIQVYGAMVEACGIRAFTNNAGEFTLSHIPVGEEFGLTATLQGYTAETASFTIPATAENLTYTLPKDIVLKASEVASYTIPVSVTIPTGVSIKYPIYVFARDSIIKSNIFFNTLPNQSVTSCDVNITNIGNYDIFVIDSNELQATYTTHIDPIEVTTDEISNKGKNAPITVAFTSTTEERKVNIVKITVPSVTEEKLDNSYFEGYVSDYVTGEGGNWKYSKITDYPNNIWVDKMNSDVTSEYDSGYFYGNSIAFFYYYEGEGADIIWQSGDSEENTINLPYSKTQAVWSLSEYNIRLAFIPDEFITIKSQYDCSSARVYLEVYDTEGIKLDNPVPCVSIVNGEEVEDTATNIPIDFRMAKDSPSGDCYLAVLYSGPFYGLKIYNINELKNTGATGATTINAIVQNESVHPDNLRNFQVLKDASGNLLFYIEGYNNGNDNITKSYIIDSSSQIKYEDARSDQRSCYIDRNGCMYRYVPATETVTDNDDSYKIIKISSPYDSENVRTATTSLNLADGSTNENINGILGFNEDSSTNTLTIYVY